MILPVGPQNPTANLRMELLTWVTAGLLGSIFFVVGFTPGFTLIATKPLIRGIVLGVVGLCGFGLAQMVLMPAFLLPIKLPSPMAWALGKPLSQKG